ncbi:MAG: homoserine dehydrogenase [Deltaproteobacteria bacterium]|nr:homoserine dehydrogenase [Deltaproteobacteria bacterium]
MRVIGLGLLGLGNVGAGVVKLLADNAAAIEARLGARVEVRRIAVQQAEKRRLVEVDKKLVTTRARDVIDDPSVDVVIELIGGTEPAREYVLGAIAKGKHVVTANKALLAYHGDELLAACAENNVEIYYEASVGGGIPLIRALREGLASDRIDEVIGIVNGTSNFILTQMTEQGRDFNEVLAEAQKAGYAEADPTLDVGGGDAAHKLAVLAALCFGTKIDFTKVFFEGIDKLTQRDFAYAERFGYTIKLLAIGKDHGDSIELRVHPTMVPKRWLLASVGGVFNAVYVNSQALGQSMYYGRGAGMMPTAVAVVSDVIEIARTLLAGAPGTRASVPRAKRPERRIRDIGELESRYYLRFGVEDRPGVLAQLAGILGDHDISIAEVVQEGRRDPQRPASVVIVTHRARESNVQAALAAIGKLPAASEPTQLVRIYETRP